MTKWTRSHPDSNSGPGWLKRNPERAAEHRRANTLRKHGLTIEGYATKWAGQAGACANPGCTFTAALSLDDYRHGLQVDHDHRTGAIRQLLCPGCNRALGAIDDDPARLAGLIVYLKRHGSREAP